MTEKIVHHITPMILTYNEAPNVSRTLDALAWAMRILIVDSGSTDETLDIVRQYPNVEVVTRPFDNPANQCNFGLSKIATSWVLSLDADYELTPELIDELQSLEVSGTAAYEAAFVYRVFGRSLRGALYPPRKILYQKGRAHYRNEGHTQRVVINGPVARLRSRVYHDDRKPLTRWFGSQQKYARIEADHLLATPWSDLRRTDRLRVMGWPAPPLVFAYTLIAKGCLLDGWPGWYYVLQRLLAETMIALEISDRRLRAKATYGNADENAATDTDIQEKRGSVPNAQPNALTANGKSYSGTDK